MSPTSIWSFLCFALSPARRAFLPTALLLAACGGGGGGGGTNQPPDLLAGVNLSGPWLFSITVTSFAGTFCDSGLHVGRVDVDPVALTHEIAARRLIMDAGTPTEMVSTMSGAQVRLARADSGAGLSTENEFVLTFSPNGEACTGTMRFHSAFGGDTCTVLGSVNGARTGIPLIDQEPAAASVHACPDSVIRATFGLPLDAGTVDSTTFQVTGPAGVVAGTVDVLGPTATFFPSAPLAEATVYTARLSTAVRSSNGRPLQQDVTWSFTTLDYEGEVLASDPVAYWRFNEPSGTTAQSLVGGTAASATFAGTLTRNAVGPWVGSTAVAFDGGFMTTTPEFATAAFQGQSILAVEFWLRPEESRPYQMYCRVGTSMFALEGSTEAPEFWLGNRTNVGSVSTPIGLWTHVVLQITGSHAEAWRNGELVRQLPFTGVLGGIDSGFKVGANDVGHFASRSLMDEVAIYHRALSAAEIQSHYAAGTHCQ